MKTVYKNSGELVHVWVHKRQAEGRTPRGNAFFEGDYYYSYGRHYCIGRHLPDGYVAINSVKSTVTTNKQVHEARYATRHLKQVFVPDPNEPPSKRRAERRIANIAEEVAIARKPEKKAALADTAREVAEHHNLFCDLVGAPNEKVEVTLLSPEEENALRARRAADAKVKRGREKLREADRLKAAVEKVAEWRAGLRSTTYLPYLDKTMLRLTQDTIETSRGARIPVDDAKRLWPIILRVMAGDRDYEVGMDLGGYSLTKIRRDGSIVVGCHDLAFDEIEGIAKQLGLVEEVIA